MVEPGLPEWAVYGDAAHRGNLISSIYLGEADLEAHNRPPQREVRGAWPRRSSAPTSTDCDDADVLLVAVQHAGADGQGRGRGAARAGRPGRALPAASRCGPSRSTRSRRSSPRATRLVVVEASAGQLEDELRLALSHAGVHAPPPIEHVRRMGGVLPSQRGDRRRTCTDAAKEVRTHEPVFYERFERHAHGEGLKATQHALLPGLRPRPRAQVPGRGDRRARASRTARSPISPVGCAVFLYYYFDVGNTQAAHGRAPAVALGHKLANPDSIVISYQGDGDLASIGLAEIVQRRADGHPDHGHLRQQRDLRHDRRPDGARRRSSGQTTATTPDGRGRARWAQPLKMAELIAQLDGPVYVERVALYDAKQRVTRAARRSRRRSQLQVEGTRLRVRRGPGRVPAAPAASTPRGGRGAGCGSSMVPVFPLGREEGRRGRAAGRAAAARASSPSAVLRRGGRHDRARPRGSPRVPARTSSAATSR